MLRMKEYKHYLCIQMKLSFRISPRNVGIFEEQLEFFARMQNPQFEQ